MLNASEDVTESTHTYGDLHVFGRIHVTVEPIFNFPKWGLESISGLSRDSARLHATLDFCFPTLMYSLRVACLTHL